jgi:hypothetical protein
MQNHTPAHAYQVDPFLAVILAVVDPFDRQRISDALIASWNETPWSRQLAMALASLHPNSSSCMCTDYQ